MSLPIMLCVERAHALILSLGRTDYSKLVIDRLVAPVGNDSIEGVPLSSFKELLETLKHACNALRWRRSAHVHLCHSLRLCESCIDTGGQSTCISALCRKLSTFSSFVPKVCGLHLLLLQSRPVNPALEAPANLCDKRHIAERHHLMHAINCVVASHTSPS